MNVSDYPIRKGVPLPPAPAEIRQDVWTQVVEALNVGDSFLLLDGDDYREPLAILEKSGKAGEVRKDDKGVFGIWRVK